MSVTKHGVFCNCGKCHDYNKLSGTAWDLSQKMLEAQEEGRDKDVDALLAQLEAVNAQALQLKNELNR